MGYKDSKGMQQRERLMLFVLPPCFVNFRLRFTSAVNDMLWLRAMQEDGFGLQNTYDTQTYTHRAYTHLNGYRRMCCGYFLTHYCEDNHWISLLVL